MERGLTYEEKIRRAEEIYARRNRNGSYGHVTTVNIRENKKKSVLKKMILQMLICLGMYSIFYLIHTTDYVFSEDVIGTTKEVLSYDVDLINLYQEISNYFQGILNQSQEENLQEEMKQEEKQENQVVIEETKMEEIEETQAQDMQNLSQEEMDVNQIKQNYSFILPLNGIVSSEFGTREVNNDLITPEHYGIDIAAEEGTQIVAAMEGEVISATYSSSFRKFCKNTE